MTKKALITILFLAILKVSPVCSQAHYELLMNGERDFVKIRASFYSWWQETGRKSSDLKKFQRWENLILPRLHHGKIPASQDWNKRLVTFNDQKLALSQKRVAEVNKWEPQGPYDWGVAKNGYSPGNGRVNCITIDPNDPDRIFIGAAAGGVWLSEDGGESWESKTDQLAVLGITDIYINPSNSSEIIILTGDAYGFDTPSVGLLKSTDGGDSWFSVGLEFDKSDYQIFYKLEVSPTNPDHMIVGGDGAYLSTDGGLNWTYVLNHTVSDVVMNPANDQIVYAVSQGEGENNTLTTFKSTDGGSTWETKPFNFDLGYGLSRKAIGVSQANPDIVYILSSHNNSTFGGLFKSSDQLSTLHLQSNSPNIFGYDEAGDDQLGQGWYDLAITVSPTDENELYVSGIHIWKSLNAGIDWSLQNYWVWDYPHYPYVHADNHTLDFANGKLYAGGDGGIFMSPDHGDTFENLSFGLNIGQFYRIGTHPTDENIIIGGLQDNGSFLKYAGKWKQIFGADGMDALIDHIEPSYMYAEYQNGGIMRFRNDGDSLELYIENAEESGGWITPFIIHPNENTTLYFGYQNVWKSTDRGNTMERISDFQTTSRVSVLKQHQLEPEKLLTYIDRNLYITIDEGENWKNITAGLPARNLTDAEFGYDNSHIIYATFSEYLEGDKVYRSTDLGKTWTDYSTGIPAIPVNCIESQKSCNETSYIGTDIGVYYRNSSMESWEYFGDGLPNVIVREVEIQYATNKLFAATYGRGIWTADLETTTPGNLVQTVTFHPPGTKTYGDDSFELIAESTTGLDIRFESSDPEILSVSGNMATIRKPGVVTVTAIQHGNCEYNLASSSQEITIAKSEQEITFAPLAPVDFSDGVVELIASTTSELPVTFESSDESILEIQGNTGTIVGFGNVDITAVNEGDDYYLEAEPVTQTLAIIPLDAGISKSFTMYPNPVEDILNLYFADKQKRTVKLYNMDGQLLQEVSLKNKSKNEVDLSNLKSGIYILSSDEVSLQIIKK